MVLNSDEEVSITLPESISSSFRAGGKFVEKAPELLALLAVVGAFLFYLHADGVQDMREWERIDTVTSMRMENLQQMQERNIQVMDKLASTLAEQGKTFTEFSISINRLRESLHLHEQRFHGGLHGHSDDK